MHFAKQMLYSPGPVISECNWPLFVCQLLSWLGYASWSSLTLKKIQIRFFSHRYASNPLSDHACICCMVGLCPPVSLPNQKPIHRVLSSSDRHCYWYLELQMWSIPVSVCMHVCISRGTLFYRTVAPVLRMMDFIEQSILRTQSRQHGAVVEKPHQP
jgi:hypothetical protein